MTTTDIPRRRFRWTDSAHVANHGDTETVAPGVFIETVDDGEWFADAAAPVERLRDSEDPQDATPYADAEDRLLGTLGLTRDDITDPTISPWN